jgi:monothiol glutaredoxin
LRQIAAQYFVNSTEHAIMTSETQAKIEKLINDNKIFVFMKGTKLMPMCGFSNNVVQILNSMGVPFETCDVLEEPEIRQGIKDYSSWPTIPQVYINGEFVGGSDVMIELYQKGELQQMLEVALAS